MFENIGEKIKAFVYVVCWIGIGLCCLVGLILLFTGNILSGLLTAAIGSLSTWLSCFFVYGFGELITQTTIVAENTQELKSKLNALSQNAAASAQPAPIPAPVYNPAPAPVHAPAAPAAPVTPVSVPNSDSIQCPQCHTVQPANRNVCWSCGLRFNAANTPKPEITRNEDGSWTCPKCQRRNLAARNTCWSCDYELE